MSGFVVGADAAVTDLEAASTYWKARGLVREYLAGARPRGAEPRRREARRHGRLPAAPGRSRSPTRLLDLMTRLATLMPPPLHEDDAKAGETKLHRVQDDAERRADRVRRLCSRPSTTRCGATRRWSHCTTAAARSRRSTGGRPRPRRRGYIVIAPEYNAARPGATTATRPASTPPSNWPCVTPGSGTRSTATASSSAAQLVGGDMAWDFGLAHPDLFAGVAIVSGMPCKYVYKLPPHADRMPLYVALGDLAPASSEIVFGQLVKPMIAEGEDVTYVEYYRRGLEDLPEEAADDLRLDGQAPPRARPQGVRGPLRPESDDAVLRRGHPGVHARPDDRPRGRRPGRQEPQSGDDQVPIEHPEQPDTSSRPLESSGSTSGSARS